CARVGLSRAPAARRQRAGALAPWRSRSAPRWAGPPVLRRAAGGAQAPARFPPDAAQPVGRPRLRQAMTQEGRPPETAIRLLRFALPADDAGSIAGDLTELFADRVDRGDKLNAIWFWSAT